MDRKTPNPARSNGTAWLRDDQHSYVLAGMIWVLVVLMIVPEGFNYQGLTAASAPSSGGAISRMLWLGLLALSAIVIFWRAGLAWLLARTLNPFLLVFVALAIASVAWSIAPSLSLRRLIRLITIVLACTAFVLMGWHARRYQNVVRPILTIMLFGSIVFGLVFPSLAIHQETSAELIGAWRGLANHKNGLGALASIALIFWFHAWLTREVRLLPALAGGAVAATCLVLSRQELTPFTRSAAQIEDAARGGYVLHDCADAQVVLIATGSEVEIAAAAAALLADMGIAARVVSMPCVELFMTQDAAYREQVLAPSLARVSIEAGVTWYWRALVGEHGLALGIDSFGESAPAGQLYEHFRLTPAHVAERVLALAKER